MRTFIPNMLTASNLVFGFFSILSTFYGEFAQAVVLIVLAMVADGMDGRVARYFKVSSEFGKELDSLCDLVSFGVAPGFLAYAYLLKDAGAVGAVAAAAFATCGALRLARFNVNTTVVKGHFMGLPIPAGGCVVATFILMGIKLPAYWFALMVAIVGYLMVSTVKYPDFKGHGEKIRVLPAALALAAGIYALFASGNSYLFAPFFTYVIFGIINGIAELFHD